MIVTALTCDWDSLHIVHETYAHVIVEDSTIANGSVRMPCITLMRALELAGSILSNFAAASKEHKARG